MVLPVAGCATRRVEVSKIPVPLTGLSLPLPTIPLRLPNVFFFFQDDTDLTHLPWVEAFDELHARLSVEYPFTEWKGGIPWDEMRQQYRAEIETAMAADDRSQYYLSLRRYLHGLSDGHVSVETDKSLMAEAVGAWFGLEIVEQADGRVMVVKVAEPAATSGIVPGAQIVAVDGQAVADALAATAT